MSERRLYPRRIRVTIVPNYLNHVIIVPRRVVIHDDDDALLLLPPPDALRMLWNNYR